ncbi:hypothetical protein AAG906_040472 [Vitis piasezkii]
MKGEESSSKARQGRKTKETEHLISRCQNFAHLIPRTSHLSLKSLWNLEQPPPSYRPWRRPEEAFPPPILTQHLDHIEPPWEPQPLFVPRPFPIREEAPSRLIPTEATHGPYATSDQAASSVLGHREEDQVLGTRRAIPRTSAEPPQRTLGFCGYSSRDRYQASHDSRTTHRGQPITKIDPSTPRPTLI